MAFTNHGHQIPFSPAEPRPAGQHVYRCGGMILCSECSRQAAAWQAAHVTNQSQQNPDANTALEETYMYETFIKKAERIVHDYVKDQLEKTDTHVLFNINDVYVVWWSKVLQNWKALISTNLPDGMYYEVTYNGDKRETYLDAYKKFQNVRFPD